MKNARKSLWGLLYKFHRYMGLGVAIFIVMMAITGIALNHTDDLQLDKRFFQAPTILNWYSIKAPDEIISFKLSQHWIAQVDQQLYFDRHPVSETTSRLVGAVETDTFIVVALVNQLILFSPQGETIEQIPRTAIQAIGVDKNAQIFIKTKTQTLVSTDDLLTWQATGSELPAWSTTATLPKAELQYLRNSFRNNILPYERVIQDIHSGSFFGRYGKYFIDLTGVLSLVVVLSGCWIWLRHKLKSYLRVRYRKH
jgi:hypothetical protein